jgi:hypothetical protein
MAQLKIDAINPVRTDTWTTFLWVARMARWELTCGFCRTRFTSSGMFFRSSAVCPACGTRNLLPNSSMPRRG